MEAYTSASSESRSFSLNKQHKITLRPGVGEKLYWLSRVRSATSSKRLRPVSAWRMSALSYTSVTSISQRHHGHLAVLSTQSISRQCFFAVLFTWVTLQRMQILGASHSQPISNQCWIGTLPRQQLGHFLQKGVAQIPQSPSSAFFSSSKRLASRLLFRALWRLLAFLLAFAEIPGIIGSVKIRVECRMKYTENKLTLSCGVVVKLKKSDVTANFPRRLRRCAHRAG